jgi:hypothetical protein
MFHSRPPFWGAYGVPRDLRATPLVQFTKYVMVRSFIDVADVDAA